MGESYEGEGKVERMEGGERWEGWWVGEKRGLEVEGRLWGGVRVRREGEGLGGEVGKWVGWGGMEGGR